MEKKNVRLQRKQAIALEDLVVECLRDLKLSPKMDEQRIFAAWDEASGAEKYTVDKAFVKGTLYCTISSSVARNKLFFQRDIILKSMNEILKKDKLFNTGGKGVNFVKYIVLK